jgi:hypothetical protein
MAIRPLRRSKNHSDFSKNSDNGKSSTEEGNASRGGWMSRRRPSESLTAKVDEGLHSSSSLSGLEETPNMEEASFAESSLFTADWNPFDDDDGWTTAASTVTSEQSSSYTAQNATRKVLKSSPLTRSTKTASRKKDTELDLLSTRSDSVLNRKREPNRATLRRSASNPIASNPRRPRRRKERNALKRSRSARSSNAYTPSDEDPKPNRGALSSFLETRPERKKEPKGKGYISSFLGASQRDDVDHDDDEFDEQSHVSLLSKGMSALEKMYEDVNK